MIAKGPTLAQIKIEYKHRTNYIVWGNINIGMMEQKLTTKNQGWHERTNEFKCLKKTIECRE
jgi:hypothetical protein